MTPCMELTSPANPLSGEAQGCLSHDRPFLSLEDFASQALQGGESVLHG